MRYKPYPKYKESGVAWLGEIPEGWEVVSLKFKIMNLNFKRIPLSAIEREKKSGKYPYYGASGIIDYVDDYIFKETTILIGEDGANLLSKSTPLAFIAKGTYWVNNHAHILKPKDKQFDFWTYVLNSIDLTPFITGSAQPKLTAEALSNLKLVFPSSLEERETISNYLDQKTQKIDTLIEKQQTLIKLLKEKRQALISHAVTKGLDDDISDWQIKKVKFNLTLQNKKVTIDKQEVIALENIESKSGKYIKTESSYKGEDVAFQKGDILFGKLRPYLSKVFECKNDGVAFGDLLVFRPNREMDSTFVFYSMLSDKFIAVVDSSTYGTKMPRASVEFINEMPMSTPPLKEQKNIAQYLDQKTKQIDTLISKSTQAIELLKERRSALISAVVTGKVDVRNDDRGEENEL